MGLTVFLIYDWFDPIQVSCHPFEAVFLVVPCFIEVRMNLTHLFVGRNLLFVVGNYSTNFQLYVQGVQGIGILVERQLPRYVTPSEPPRWPVKT